MSREYLDEGEEIVHDDEMNLAAPRQFDSMETVKA